MRRIILLPALLLALAVVSGCVSPYRLFDLTPLDTSPSQNTVNLWPLYYANEKGTSVLWPVFDSDEHGFALRPLIFHQSTEWGILWPLSDFDTNYFRLLNLVIAEGEGGLIPFAWIAPGDFYQFLLAFKADDSWGVFPFLYHGEDTSYFFPLYYYDRFDESFLTPISYFSPDFNCFTLAWWNRENGHWGLFPLCHVGREGHHFLIWWKTPHSTGLFPFYISVNDFAAAGPVWWNEKSWGVFPFCRFGEESSRCLTWWKTPDSTGLFPLYYKDDDLTAIGPVWWNKDNSQGVFPLFARHSSPSENEVSLLYHVLGGYAKSRQDDTLPVALSAPREFSLDWLCYLGKYKVVKKGDTRVSRHFRMAPLFDYASKPLDDSADTDEIGRFYHNALFGALWNYNSTRSRKWVGKQALDCTELSRLIKHVQRAIIVRNANQDSPAELIFKDAQPQGDDNTDLNQTVDDIIKDYILDINELCDDLDLEPPAEMTVGNLDDLASRLELKYPRTTIRNRSFGMLLDLVDYEKLDGNSSFKLLWGTLFKREASPAKTETSVLWRGFRQVTTPTAKSREIFPFITYYSNQEDQTTVSSFGWRLFRRETSPEGNKLWLFFIPFQ